MANRQEIVREIDKLNKSVEDASLRKEEALLELGMPPSSLAGCHRP